MNYRSRWRSSCAYRWPDIPSQARDSQDGDDTTTYHDLYTHLQKEFTELQRAHQLLQTRLAPGPATDAQREERSLASLAGRLAAAETRAADLEKVLQATGSEGQVEVGKRFMEEKHSLVQLNLSLSEKVRAAEEREERARAELQDSKDQVSVQ